MKSTDFWSSRSKPSGEMGWLPGNHQILPADPGSSTKNLSFGDRPVCCPVSAVSAPVATIEASPLVMACSYSSAGDRLCQVLIGAPTPTWSRTALSTSCMGAPRYYGSAELGRSRPHDRSWPVAPSAGSVSSGVRAGRQGDGGGVTPALVDPTHPDLLSRLV